MCVWCGVCVCGEFVLSLWCVCVWCVWCVCVCVVCVCVVYGVCGVCWCFRARGAEAARVSPAFGLSFPSPLGPPRHVDAGTLVRRPQECPPFAHGHQALEYQLLRQGRARRSVAVMFGQPWPHTTNSKHDTSKQISRSLFVSPWQSFAVEAQRVWQSSRCHSLPWLCQGQATDGLTRAKPLTG